MSIPTFLKLRLSWPVWKRNVNVLNVSAVVDVEKQVSVSRSKDLPGSRPMSYVKLVADMIREGVPIVSRGETLFSSNKGKFELRFLWISGVDGELHESDEMSKKKKRCSNRMM